jgi:hypothetical protein
MSKKLIWVTVLISLAVVGFAKQHAFKSSPVKQTANTPHYIVELEPLYAEGYKYFNRFRYSFTNKTDGDLIIDWEKSYYIQNGKRYGNFGWEGLTFEELKNIKENPQTTVAPKQTETDEIFPLMLIGWREEGVLKEDKTPEAGFTLGVIPAGEAGLSIAVLKDGKVLRKTISVKISHE